ncbi:MAG: three-Cys-motif partner protein TcmP [Candidatus Nanopelagicales bacterium]
MKKFHDSKKSAAVLKHAIIDKYATPFATKTSSTSAGKRVAFVDGYAGPGRYADGTEGSGALLLRKAHELAGMSRPARLELHFVEDDPDTVELLEAVVASEGSNVIATVTPGDISIHMPTLLDECASIPLFVYMDPCGLLIPFDDVVKIFDRPRGLGKPATEVLINFSASSLRRIAGHLTSEKGLEATLVRMDEVCGGPWWREVWQAHWPDGDAAETAVVEGYAERLRDAAGGAATWVIDVRPRPGLKPVYYLVFATRHIDGAVLFGESASLGLKAWRRYLAEAAADGLFAATWEEDWRAAEKALDASWIQQIADRIAVQLARGPFRTTDRYEEVFGDLVGVARSTHLRKAIEKLFKEGVTSTNPKGVAQEVLVSLRIKPV